MLFTFDMINCSHETCFIKSLSLFHPQLQVKFHRKSKLRTRHLQASLFPVFGTLHFCSQWYGSLKVTVMESGRSWCQEQTTQVNKCLVQLQLVRTYHTWIQFVIAPNKGDSSTMIIVSSFIFCNKNTTSLTCIL